MLFLFMNESYCGDSTKTNINYKHGKTIWQNIGNDFGVFFKDWGEYLIFPFRMSGKDWLIGGGVIGGTLLSSLADKEIKKRVSVQGAATYNHNFLDAPTAYGYVQYPSIFSGGLYLAGLISGSDNIRVTARMLMQSLVYSGTITMGIRYLLGRERPFESEIQYSFLGFQTKGDNESFPSGHTVVAFATSTVLAERINTWWSRAILYPFAFLTAYARVHNNQHWFSDVLFGGLLGYGSSLFVLNQEDKRVQNDKKNKKGGGKFSFYPSFNGFSIVYKL